MNIQQGIRKNDNKIEKNKLNLCELTKNIPNNETSICFGPLGHSKEFFLRLCENQIFFLKKKIIFFLIFKDFENQKKNNFNFL